MNKERLYVYDDLDEEIMSKYIVKTAYSWKKGYAHVAVIEVKDDVRFSHIRLGSYAQVIGKDENKHETLGGYPKGVIEVVWFWLNCWIGSTDRCAFAKAYKSAKFLARKLNKNEIDFKIS